MQDNLVPMTIRLEPAVGEALARAAQTHGQETADYVADIVSRTVLDELRETEPDVARRLSAEIDIKGEAIRIARHLAETEAHPDNSDVTLRVFRRIKENTSLSETYVRAIGGRAPDKRGNPTKARLNRSIGAAIKAALSANSRMNGDKPAKVQVGGEYIFSYTPLILPQR